MMKNAILLMVLACGAFTVQGQWQFGSHFGFGTANSFTWQDGSDLAPWQVFKTDIFGEYRFKLREQGAVTLQSALRVDLQSVQFSTNSNGRALQDGGIRMPVRWVQVMPRLLQGERYPLLEMVSGIGGYVGKPLYAFGVLGDGADRVQGYWTYGLVADLGVNFYIQTGSRFYVGYNFGLDIGTFGARQNDTVRQFSERAFTIGFSSSVPDTRERMRTARERRAARKLQRQ